MTLRSRLPAVTRAELSTQVALFRTNLLARPTSNRYGAYGNPYSPNSINNPYGAGSTYRTQPLYVVRQR